MLNERGKCRCCHCQAWVWAVGYVVGEGGGLQIGGLEGRQWARILIFSSDTPYRPCYGLLFGSWNSREGYWFPLPPGILFSRVYPFSSFLLAKLLDALGTGALSACTLARAVPLHADYTRGKYDHIPNKLSIDLSPLSALLPSCGLAPMVAPMAV